MVLHTYINIAQYISSSVSPTITVKQELNTLVSGPVIVSWNAIMNYYYYYLLLNIKMQYCVAARRLYMQGEF